MLTQKQENVLNLITEYIHKYAKAPTIDELKEALNQKSKRGVSQYLEALEKKGFITRGGGFRSIRIGNRAGTQTMLNIPVLGFANAGKPLAYAEETTFGVLPLSKDLVSGDPKSYFALKVDGTSMNEFVVKGKNIENGSYILVNKNEVNANEKDAFLFIVDGCATVKKMKKEGNNIYLVPVSRDTYHSPIIVSEGESLSVNGKVVDVFNIGTTK